MSDIAAWLERLELGKYADVFADNDIDIDVLAELSDADLKDLGVSLGERKRLLKAGDKVVTTGGIHGTVVGITDQIVQVRIADQVKIELSKQAVAAVRGDG